jgi:hypothetical protein
VRDSMELARRSNTRIAAAGFDFASAIALFWAAIHCLCVTPIPSIGLDPVDKASNVHDAMNDPVGAAHHPHLPPTRCLTAAVVRRTIRAVHIRAVANGEPAPSGVA